MKATDERIGLTASHAGIPPGDRRTRASRGQASRVEMFYAIVMLVLASNVVYAAFMAPAGAAFARAGDSAGYSMLWASGYLALALLVVRQFGSVLAIFARNWSVGALLFALLLPEMLEPVSWLRLVLLFCTVTFSAWMASRFSLTDLIVTLYYVYPIMIVIHALAVIFVPAGNLADGLERDSIPGFKIYAGLFAHKNQAGIAFSTAFIFYSLLLILAPRFSWRKMLGAATSLLFLLLSGSANALLTTVVTLYASLLLWALIRARMNVVYLTVPTTIVLAVPLIVNRDLLFEALGRSSDLTGRTYIWTAWPGIFYDHLLTGYGYSGFEVAGGPAERLWDLATFDAASFHNSFLDIGIQAGLLGMISLVLIVLMGVGRTAAVAYISRRPFALIVFALFLDLCLFGSGEDILITHNSFVTICLLTIHFQSGIELRARAGSRIRAFISSDKRPAPVFAHDRTGAP